MTSRIDEIEARYKKSGGATYMHLPGPSRTEYRLCNDDIAYLLAIAKAAEKVDEVIGSWVICLPRQSGKTTITNSFKALHEALNAKQT